MIATLQDLLVLTEQDYDRLPDEGRWEVVDGRAVLLPPNDFEHQHICDELLLALRAGLRALGYGCAVSATGVRIPLGPGAPGEVRSRIPDLSVARYKPRRYFSAGKPPELVIEVLATRRGNVERTEKLDDYAWAGIGEYWIVNPIDRVVEVYRLRDGDYVLEPGPQPILRPQAFPGLEIDLAAIWAVLD